MFEVEKMVGPVEAQRARERQKKTSDESAAESLSKRLTGFQQGLEAERSSESMQPVL